MDTFYKIQLKWTSSNPNGNHLFLAIYFSILWGTFGSLHKWKIITSSKSGSSSRRLLQNSSISGGSPKPRSSERSPSSRSGRFCSGSLALQLFASWNLLRIECSSCRSGLLHGNSCCSSLSKLCFHLEKETNWTYQRCNYSQRYRKV